MYLNLRLVPSGLYPQWERSPTIDNRRGGRSECVRLTSEDPHSNPLPLRLFLSFPLRCFSCTWYMYTSIRCLSRILHILYTFTKCPSGFVFVSFLLFFAYPILTSYVCVFLLIFSWSGAEARLGEGAVEFPRG